MEEELEAELEESVASARLNSNAGSNAGVAVGPLRFARPRSRGRERAVPSTRNASYLATRAKWAQTQERLLELPRPYSLPNRRTGGRLGNARLSIRIKLRRTPVAVSILLLSAGITRN